MFFGNFLSSISDARTPLDILLSLKDTRSPATAEELRFYLWFLVGRQFHELAYYAWLQFLPPEQLAETGLLFNGNFEVSPSGMPFDWGLTQGSGVRMQIAPRNDQPGHHALFLKFGPGRVEDIGLKQLILLPPGSYTFRGGYTADLVSDRGLRWRITCEGNEDAIIGQSEAVKGSVPKWTDFEFPFTVPDDCGVQKVRLFFDARSASEQLISGSIWYDDLQIVREAAPKAQE